MHGSCQLYFLADNTVFSGVPVWKARAQTEKLIISSAQQNNAHQLCAGLFDSAW